jgi:uncharacterized protein (DUF362 family)/Pyruvate/2-oxoacid:ferredoxin oxidoreductase delta subunit
MKNRVAVVRVDSYDEVEGGIRKAVSLIGGIKCFVARGSRVLLKPNLLSPNPPEKAVTTHPAVVEAVAKIVAEAGGHVLIGDSPMTVSLDKVAEVAGITAVANKLGAELVPFRRSVVLSPPPLATFKKIEVAGEVVKADVLVNLPKVKTHDLMGLTLAVKNLFGCVVGKRKPQWHLKAGRDPRFFASLLLDLSLLLKPPLTIVDGVIGMEGEGPGSRGTTRRLGFVMAGEDPLAIDFAIAYLLGVSPDKLPHLSEAKRRRLSDTNSFELLGDDLSGFPLSDFQMPRFPTVKSGLLSFLNRFFKKQLSTYPVVDDKRCILCERCVSICPAKAMTKVNRRIAIDYRKCISCFCCHEVCPEGAIEVVEGWLARKAFLSG